MVASYDSDEDTELHCSGWVAGVRVAHLMSWQERLVSLRDLGYHDAALSTGLSIYAVALATDDMAAVNVAVTAASRAGPQPHQVAHQSAGSAEVSEPWPGEGRGAGAAAVSQALTSLLKGYLDAALMACSADSEVTP